MGEGVFSRARGYNDGEHYFLNFPGAYFLAVLILGVKVRWEVIYLLKSQVPYTKLKLTLAIALEKKMTIYDVIMLIT